MILWFYLNKMQKHIGVFFKLVFVRICLTTEGLQGRVSLNIFFNLVVQNTYTVLIHLSGRSLIRTVSVEKRMQKNFNIKHKQLIKFREFSAKKREKTIKQTSIHSYFSKTSNKN